MCAFHFSGLRLLGITSIQLHVEYSVYGRGHWSVTGNRYTRGRVKQESLANARKGKRATALVYKTLLAKSAPT